jgi:hypothetical protein
MKLLKLTNFYATAAMSAPVEGAPAAAEKVVRPKLLSQNGVSQPSLGTKTRRVWEIADEISAAEGRPALRGEVAAKAEAEGINKGTIATQYAKWCIFYAVDAGVRKAARAAKAAAKEAEAAPQDEEVDGA